MVSRRLPFKTTQPFRTSFWAIVLQMALQSSDGYLKKCGDLLLEDHGFPFE